MILQKDTAVEVDGEMAAILQHSRFSTDFDILMVDKQNSSSTPQEVRIQILLMLVTHFFSSDRCFYLFFAQYCHLNPFLLADKLGSSVKQCSKTGK